MSSDAELLEEIRAHEERMLQIARAGRLLPLQRSAVVMRLVA